MPAAATGCPVRVADRPPPTVPAHAFPTGVPLRPVIAIEPQPVPLAWDTALTWDSGLTWDANQNPGPWVDAFCDYQGFATTAGNPDDHGLFDAARLELQLDNGSGRWSQYAADGSLVNYGPGRHVAVWAVDAAAGAWWVFYGRVARWDERPDGTVIVEAFDAFSDLAQPIGGYTPGANGDRPGARLAAIMAAARYTDRVAFDTGLVTLTAQATEQSPLEEAQTVAASDGGVLVVDADGTVMFRDRTWRGGRTDQPRYPILSDNVCTAELVVWDATLSSNDSLLADRVVLENVAGLRATATAARPIGAYVYTETDQQWTVQADGDTLAAALLGALGRRRVAVDTFTVYLFDPRQPSARTAIDWRLGDRVRFLHDTTAVDGVARLDVAAIVATIEHDVTPDAWVMTVATTRAVDTIPLYLWDDPTARYLWDTGVPWDGVTTP